MYEVVKVWSSILLRNVQRREVQAHNLKRASKGGHSVNANRKHNQTLDVCRCAYERRTPNVAKVGGKKIPLMIQKRKPREKYDLHGIKMKVMQDKDYHIILFRTNF
jgi:hypothetical protein